MNDTVLPADAPAVKVRMDRSRAFGEIHGDRVPGDRYATVFFTQDGLPFDSQGFLLSDHPMVAESPKLQELADRKLKKAADQAAKMPAPRERAAEDGDSDDVEDDGNPETEPINLERWLKGEQKVQWHEASQEIARRFLRRFTKQDEAVEWLISEHHLVPKAALTRQFQKYVD